MKRALILAAGRGQRLDRPGTPKPLVDIGGRPIITRLIDQLSRAGVKEVHVIVGYKGDSIRRAVAGHPFNGTAVFIHDNAEWESGMASSLLCEKTLFDEPFLLVMGDHVFDESLIEKMARLKPEAGTVVALIDTNWSNNPSLETALKIRLNCAHIIEVGWNLENIDGIDVGLFAATPKLFEAVDEAASENPDAGLSDALSVLALDGYLQWESSEGKGWDDIDTPADVVRAETRIRASQRVERIMPMTDTKAPAMVSTEFDYIIGKPESVSMLVRRGVIAEPAGAGIVPSQSASSPIFVFTDETVRNLYGEVFVAKLSGAGYSVNLITLPDGEEAKTLSNYVYLVERVLSRGVDERSLLISLGGGVPCNVCGFVASTIYRGLDLVHIPTTLMAQCDAAISHKQAINGQRGKNMVGTYYNPRMVIVDVEALRTLDRRQVRDGMAEVIKHGLGQDASLASLLMEHGGGLDDLDFLETVIMRNIELKCALVRNDPKEHREGMVLQYGHTAGHPVEHLSGYSLYHGESVAIGMMVAARVAQIMGACDESLVEYHREIIGRFGLPTTIPSGIGTEDMLRAMRFNKRYLTEGTRMALLSGVGRLWNVDGDYVIPVPDKVLSMAIDQTREKL